MTKPDIFTIELHRLADSPSQPRSTYSGLDELADSIRQHGVLQPILCRPITEYQIGGAPDQDLEIVAGHRRVRAAVLAELDDIPAIIRPMSDLEVLQVQIVENLQREDVSPLDEARAYAMLRDQHGQTIRQIAESLGTSERHVSARIQLLKLTGKARQALIDGVIGSEIALLICATPSLVHDQALQQVTRITESLETVALPIRAARTALRNSKLLHEIMQAHFDILLPGLIDSAGPCMQCPRMTTNMGDDAMEQLGSDVCTDRVCYQAKNMAHGLRELENLRDNGWTILDAEPAFGSWQAITSDRALAMANALQINPELTKHRVAWIDGVTKLPAAGYTTKGYTEVLHTIYPAPPPPAARTRPEGEWGARDDETTVATKRDTSDQDPTTLTPEGGKGAREALRFEIVMAALGGAGWPPGRAELNLVCAALACVAGDEAHAMIGMPRICRAGVGAMLDEIANWPENRVAISCTVLAIMNVTDELPADRCVALLDQLHARYLGGRGDKTSHGSAAGNQEDQASLTAGDEVMDDARPGAVEKVSDDAGLKARPRANRALYRDPATGQTWSGRGLKPLWLRQKLDAGHVLADFTAAKATSVDAGAAA